MHRIAVIGTGHVGLVTGACLAHMGHQVCCADRDESRIRGLRNGITPFFEPALSPLLADVVRTQKLSFTHDTAEAVADAEIVFIAISASATFAPSPPPEMRQLVADIANSIDHDALIVNKSTAAIGTCDFISSAIEGATGRVLSLVSNPEFLREGSAIKDFFNPDRIVLGCSDESAEATMRALYGPLNAPFIVTDFRTAEMIKYAANAFLATKISFINEMTTICDEFGVDISGIVAGVSADKRIGIDGLVPGIGFGGSCLPKDLGALIELAEIKRIDAPLLAATLEVNEGQLRRLVRKLDEHLGGLKQRRLCVWGLAFKPNTDDVRSSPAVSLCDRLVSEGATVVVHDPQALSAARDVLGQRVLYAKDPYDAARGADAVIVATDWDVYKRADLARLIGLMNGRLFVDGRSAFLPVEVNVVGLDYIGIGSQSVANATLCAS